MLKYCLIALALTPQLAVANEAPDRDTLLGFIQTNQLDANLYNLLAATIPSTPAGKALYGACEVRQMEDLFENGYTHVRKTMGDTWRGTLADVYTRHLTSDDLSRLSALEEGNARRTAISDALTIEPIIDDLRQSLSPLVEEATARHVNHMLDEAETLCKVGE